MSSWLDLNKRLGIFGVDLALHDVFEAVEVDGSFRDVEVEVGVDGSFELGGSQFFKGSVDAVLDRKIRVVPDYPLGISHLEEMNIRKNFKIIHTSIQSRPLFLIKIVLRWHHKLQKKIQPILQPDTINKKLRKSKNISFTF